MLFDFNEAWSRASEAKYDVCICGTGPAGITTARRLAALGKKVLLLEGGGLSYSDQSEDIYKGRSVGAQYWLLEAGRLRYFGGSSNHWQGRCGIFDPIDFEPRDYFGLPGWPISRQQVLKGIEEAKEILDISGKDLVPFEDPEFKSPFFVRSGYALSPPTRFSEKYRAEIQRSAQIDAFYNANLVDLRLDDDLTRVNHFLIRNYNGQRVEVSASQFVMALGAIENARILLNADSQVPAGIGNHSGMVGRCFMEHLDVPIGRFLITDPHFWQRGGIPLAPSEALMRKNDIGNGIIDFDPSNQPKSFGRFRLLKQFLRETGCVLPGLAKIARRVVDFDCPGDGVISSLIEQAPNLDSRVSLTDDVDAFNLRRVQLNWQLNDNDRKTIRILAMEAAKEMARLNRARVQLAPYILDSHLEIEVGGHSHQMGTTRMSADSRYGVVDENCRVHGIRNLYLVGSSVFPTGGGTNPTLTIVLLALRLADFLSGKD
jgi:choline dehydrogenase-like flavoprotein